MISLYRMPELLFAVCVSSVGLAEPFFVASVAQRDEPTNVQALRAAHAEWVNSACFSATYRRATGYGPIDRDSEELESWASGGATTGHWCKRGQLWRMSAHNDEPPLIIRDPTSTEPGAAKGFSWERLCSREYFVEYLVDKPADQAGLTRRIRSDGSHNGNFREVCLETQSILNPFGSKLRNPDTNEWKLPGLPVGFEITYSIAESDESHLTIVANWTVEDGFRSETRYRFLTAADIPVIEQIRSTFRIDADGNSAGFQDAYLSGFKPLDSGTLLPTRMEIRSGPLTFDKGGERGELMRVSVWDVELESIAPPDADFEIEFADTTTFSGFHSPPPSNQAWSLVGFLDVPSEGKFTPPESRSGTSVVLGGLAAVVLALLIAAIVWCRQQGHRH